MESEPEPLYDEAFLERIRKCEHLFSKKLSASLKKHFVARLGGKSKVIATDDARRILKMLLPIFKTMSDGELQRYGYVLRYYIKMWPRFETVAAIYKVKHSPAEKEELVNLWYKEFATYVILKMEDCWKMWLQYKQKQNLNQVEQTTQTGPNPDDEQAQPQLCIHMEGPASLGYCGVVDVDGDNIIFTQQVSPPCSENYYPLNIEGFLNLPYVSVRGNYADFSFERTNVHQVDRFLSKKVVNFKKRESEPMRFEKLNQENEITLYTKQVTLLYLRQFIYLVQRVENFDKFKKTECLTVIIQILHDVKEYFEDGMPSHTKITFPMGNNYYYRDRSNSNAVKFYETIKPKVALTVHDFEPVQDLTDLSRISFDGINFYERNINAFLEHVHGDRLTFSCTFCVKDYPCMFQLHKHFKTEHKEEPEVICSGCNKQIKVYDLVQKRWNHSCGHGSNK